MQYFCWQMCFLTATTLIHAIGAGITAADMPFYYQGTASPHADWAQVIQIPSMVIHFGHQPSWGEPAHTSSALLDLFAVLGQGLHTRPNCNRECQRQMLWFYGHIYY